MDREEFTRAVLEYENTLYRVAKSMLGSEADWRRRGAKRAAARVGAAAYAQGPDVFQDLADAHFDKRVPRHIAAAREIRPA